MSFRFEQLTVWQDARLFASHVYEVTKSFPQSEQFGLTTQLRRAAISVALNIAEGSMRRSDIEFKRYLRVSLGSLNEVVTALYIAKDERYLNQQAFDRLYGESNMVAEKFMH